MATQIDHVVSVSCDSRRFPKCLLPILVAVATLIFEFPVLCSSLVVELHYGLEGGLNIGCRQDELILIVSETLAYSPDDRCLARSPSCSVPYSQASWYCRGKSSCSGMPVERRPLHRKTCGADFTNCLRVDYQCVKST